MVCCSNTINKHNQLDYHQHLFLRQVGSIMGTSTSHLWVYWIIFGHLFNPSYSLVVHLFNFSNSETTSEITFKSQYTSLGTPPKHQPLRSNLVYLSSYNFSDCSFSQATNIHSIKGSIVLLESTPPWHPCAHAEAGMAPALGRMIQKVGGIGVLTASLEKVSPLFLPLSLHL